MEKLELKHLAPYLPYGLKGKWDTVIASSIWELDCEILEPDYTNLKNPVYSYFGKNPCMPILRPLSDLTTNAFVFKKDLEHIKIHKEVITMRYYVVEYLFQNHYDVFGLIEQKLAIDINTLKP